MGAAPETGSRVLVEPWLLTEEDIPWLFQLGRKKYSAKYDAVTTEGWFRNIVLKQPVMFHPVRMPNAFCISMLSIMPWLPAEAECNVVFICCDDGCMWEGMKLLRASIAWGKLRRCAIWRLSSDTDYDLQGMATRLGAKEISPRFCLRYDDVPNIG